MIGKLKCPDGCGMDLDDSIKWIAQSIEKEIGQELDVTSGARCPKYNATIAGSIAGDAHTMGKAIDIFIDGTTPQGRELAARIVIAAVKAGIKRFGDGILKHSYLHIDCSADLPNPRMWFYP